MHREMAYMCIIHFGFMCIHNETFILCYDVENTVDCIQTKVIIVATLKLEVCAFKVLYVHGVECTKSV